MTAVFADFNKEIVGGDISKNGLSQERIFISTLVSCPFYNIIY
jgi:hypothetical protein